MHIIYLTRFDKSLRSLICSSYSCCPMHSTMASEPSHIALERETQDEQNDGILWSKNPKKKLLLRHNIKSAYWINSNRPSGPSPSRPFGYFPNAMSAKLRTLNPSDKNQLDAHIRLESRQPAGRYCWSSDSKRWWPLVQSRMLSNEKRKKISVSASFDV